MSDTAIDNTPDTDEDTEAAEAAENTSQTTQDETIEPDAVDDEASAADDAQDEPQDDSGRRRGVRERLREAEAERDALRDTLARQQQAVYEDAIERAGVSGVLMTAAQRGVETFVGANGVVYPAVVAEAASEVAAEAGIPRRPKADPIVGRGSEGETKPKVTFGSLLRAAVENGQ